MSGHQDWEEIAAGHALGALEPDDEQRFEAHLQTCAECREVIAETEAIMADLAYAAEPQAAPPELKSRLMAAIHDESAGPSMAMVQSLDGLEVLRRHRRRRSSALDVMAEHWVRFAVAASIILLAFTASGVWALNATKTAPDPKFVALSSTQGLTNPSSNVATVELIGDKAWVITSGLTSNDSSNSQYVLWSVPVHGNPQAIAGFDVRAGSGAAIVPAGHVGALASITGFAVSKEKTRSLPSAPTDIVAKGDVGWQTSEAFRSYS